MSYFKVCPICGSHLDPGESCADCRDKNTPAGAANTDEGKVEKVLEGSDSASIITQN